MVVALLLLMVLGAVRLVGLAAGEPDTASGEVGAVAAARSAAGPADATPTAGAGSGPGAGEPGPGTEADAKARARKEGAKRKKSSSKPKAPPKPDGPCEDSDILITPVSTEARPWGRVEIALDINTHEARACTWEVTPETLFVKISTADADRWSSQHCPQAIPTTTVVARKKQAARVRVVWRGKESAPGCPGDSPWVDAGTYVVAAVARGSVEPHEATLRLRADAGTRPGRPAKHKRHERSQT